MSRLLRLLTRRWFQLGLHVLVILGLIGGLLAATVANGPSAKSSHPASTSAFGENGALGPGRSPDS